MRQENYKELYSLSYYRKFRHRFINPIVISKLELSQKDRVIDIGCGNGDYTGHISKIVSYCCGIDFSPAAISLAKQKYPSLDFYPVDIEQVFFQENFFTKGLCFHVLEHLPREKIHRCLLEIKRIVIGGGIIVFGTLDKGKIFSKFVTKDPTHIEEFNREGFIKLLRGYFKIVDIGYTANTKIPLFNYLVGYFVGPDIIVKVRNQK